MFVVLWKKSKSNFEEDWKEKYIKKFLKNLQKQKKKPKNLAQSWSRPGCNGNYASVHLQVR